MTVHIVAIVKGEGGRKGGGESGKEGAREEKKEEREGEREGRLLVFLLFLFSSNLHP